MSPVPGAGTRHTISVEADSDVRLDLLVARHLDVSRTQAATWIAEARVLVNERREKAAYRPLSGDVVLVEVPAPVGREVVPQDLPLVVVYEDDELLVIDKAAGMVVHPAPGHWEGTVVNALAGRGGPLSSLGGADRAGLVHRLDKDTSGLLLIARTERAHRVLGDALMRREIVRRYAALAWGHVDDDRIDVDQPLARDPRNRQRMAVVRTGKSARTTFVRLARYDSVDLLRAHLHTGRTHQIRVHLSHLGHPVVGDDVYGGGGGRRLVKLPAGRHFLHAARLRFKHPVTGIELDFRSPLPADLRQTLAAVARDPAVLDAGDPLDDLGFYDEDEAHPRRSSAMSGGTVPVDSGA
ncbi:MAG: RluA family pseudouridine synthase [Gemmatimonadetes bacterium]|nr:RluA family pseudouridine synthase [Gemmatimonadota bacterium]